jgi:glycerophosphoryl diester phosphodiesterase
MYRNTSCLLQAHRGVSTDAPENTMAAFRMAKAQGYDLIEFDPKFTKDNVCIVLHDRTLKRTGRVAGEPVADPDRKITEITYPELANVDVGSWFGESFVGERVPTLSQALDYMKSINMEAKIDNVVQSFTEEQIEILFDIVEKHGNDRVGLTCSNLSLLRRYAERFPLAPLHYDGPVSEEALDELTSFAAGHRTVVWMRLDNKATAWNKTPPVNDEYSELVHGYGYLLGVWILHTDEEMEKAIAFGADIVETTGGIKP